MSLQHGATPKRRCDSRSDDASQILVHQSRGRQVVPETGPLGMTTTGRFEALGRHRRRPIAVDAKHLLSKKADLRRRSGEPRKGSEAARSADRRLNADSADGPSLHGRAHQAVAPSLGLLGCRGAVGRPPHRHLPVRGVGRDVARPRRPHTTIKSFPTMISPLKYFAARDRQASSVTPSMNGTRCDRTSVLTPASCAIRPTSSTDVWSAFMCAM